MELSPIYTLSMCLHTVFGQCRGVGPLYILSGYRIWQETAERNFGFLYSVKMTGKLGGNLFIWLSKRTEVPCCHFLAAGRYILMLFESYLCI